MSAFYAGVDLSARSSWICVVNTEGEQLLSRKLPNDPDRIARTLKPLLPNLAAVVESTFNWYGMVDLLQDLERESSWLIRSTSRRSPTPKSRPIRSTLTLWRNFCAWTTSRRPSSTLANCVPPEICFAVGIGWSRMSRDVPRYSTAADEAKRDDVWAQCDQEARWPASPGAVLAPPRSSERNCRVAHHRYPGQGNLQARPVHSNIRPTAQARRPAQDHSVGLARP